MKYKYEDKIVAFIDILGFAEKVKQTTKAIDGDKKLEQLCGNILTIGDYIREEQLSKKIIITQFSDSIVISIKKENSSDVLHMFHLLKRIQANFIKDNVLLRGGIVFGKLIHNDEILLGPALNNAYYLESKCALYPRIVIDPQVLWQFYRKEGVKKAFRLKDLDYHKTFMSDLDGTYYIDYFNDIKNYLSNSSIESYIESLSKIIKSSVRNEDINIRIKYLWMRSKLKSSEYFLEFKHIYSGIDKSIKSKTTKK